MLATEGLLAPIFRVLRVKNVSPISARYAVNGGAGIVSSIAPGLIPSSEGGPELEGSAGGTPRCLPSRRNASEGDGVWLCSVGDRGAFNWDWDPGSECGKGYGALDGGLCRIR